MTPWWILLAIVVLLFYILRKSVWWERNQNVTIGEFIDKVKERIRSL